MNNKLSNIEIEKVILGAIIDTPNLFYSHFDRITSSLFSATKNRQIFEIIKHVHNENKPIDILIIQSEILRRNLDLNAYLTEIIEGTTFTSNFEHYLTILTELSVRREVILTFNKIIKSVNNPEENIYNIRDKSIEEFNKLFIDRFIDTNKSNETFSKLVDRVEEKFSKLEDGIIPGIESSLNIINKVFGGWQNSDLVIVAGRPGMGKSAFMVQQIIDVSNQNKAVGVFSLEMSAEQITARIITNFMEIPNSSILRKGLNEEEWWRYDNHKDDLTALNIHIDDTPNISIENLRVKAKMMKMRYDIEILMIDYLQLITFEKSQNREQEVSKISRNLKAIAKELDIPVIALAQLSRYVEQRADKRPLLSDLRDSGAVEQDADEVLFIYRPEYYGIEEWGNEYNNEPTARQAEIIIAKNRHGGTLSERCMVNLSTSTFTDFYPKKHT